MIDIYLNAAKITSSVTSIDEVHNPNEQELVAVWFLTRFENSYKRDEHGCIETTFYEIDAIEVDNSHPWFGQIKKWFDTYMYELQSKRDKESNDAEYQKYLELKSKFEDK